MPIAYICRWLQPWMHLAIIMLDFKSSFQRPNFCPPFGNNAWTKSRPYFRRIKETGGYALLSTWIKSTLLLYYTSGPIQMGLADEWLRFAKAFSELGGREKLRSNQLTNRLISPQQVLAMFEVARRKSAKNCANVNWYAHLFTEPNLYVECWSSTAAEAPPVPAPRQQKINKEV